MAHSLNFFVSTMQMHIQLRKGNDDIRFAEQAVDDYCHVGADPQTLIDAFHPESQYEIDGTVAEAFKDRIRLRVREYFRVLFCSFVQNLKYLFEGAAILHTHR